jgi:S-adenosylmethionine-diacylglycerol 3-amino-3-carboxypropyl transferase
VDRAALELGPDDTVLVITSAGCNALDYALTGPRRIHAVDSNPRQTALLELKLAGIRRLDFADFFALFGTGHHADFADILHERLAPDLSPFARAYWTERTNWFAKPGSGFYFHGLSGIVARAVRAYFGLHPRLKAGVVDLLDSPTLEDQRRIYDDRVGPCLWRPGLNWTLSRQTTMSFLGVPYPQRRQVEAQHERGVAGFICESVEYVFRQLPLSTNYFWTVYLRGRYTPGCCPEYLKAGNFARLKAGLGDRIRPHTATVTGFLKATDEQISKFVLLDHMDWMSSYHPGALDEEWTAILERARPGARVIFRSAHARPGYIGQVRVGDRRRPLTERLRFHDALARALQPLDRVHTYAGFHIADIAMEARAA